MGSGAVRKRSGPLWLLTGVVLYVVGSAATLVVLQAARTSIAEQYHIYLPVWLGPVSSGLIIVALYPVFGGPVADRHFSHDTYQRKLERQFWWSVLFFPVLCIVIEVSILLGVILVLLPTQVPTTFLTLGAVLSIINSLIGIVVGVPCALGLSWFSESVRELPYYSR